MTNYKHSSPNVFLFQFRVPKGNASDILWPTPWDTPSAHWNLSRQWGAACPAQFSHQISPEAIQVTSCPKSKKKHHDPTAATLHMAKHVYSSSCFFLKLLPQAWLLPLPWLHHRRWLSFTPKFLETDPFYQAISASSWDSKISTGYNVSSCGGSINGGCPKMDSL